MTLLSRTRPVPMLAPGPPLPPVRPASPRARARAPLARVIVAIAIWSLPLLRPSGPGNTGPVDVVLVVAMIISALVVSRAAPALHFPYAVPVGLSIAAGALAGTVAAMGGQGNAGSELLALMQDLFLLAWAIAVANIAREPAMLRTLTRAWALSAAFWAAVLILGVFGHISALSGETAREGARASLTLGDPNVAANYFVCSLLVLRAARYPRRRALRWLCCVAIIVAIGLTGSNGGALALVVATVLGALFKLARRRGMAPALAVAAALALGSAATAPLINVQAIVMKAQASVPVLKDSLGRQAESSGSRDMILSETARLYLSADNPFGLGPGETKTAFQAHQYPYVKEAHDDYAAALVERGVLGATALILLLTTIAVRCRRIVARPLRPWCAAAIPRPELLVAAVVAIFLSAMFYEILHFRHVWALFGVIAAVDLWGRADGPAPRRQVRGPGAPAAAKGPPGAGEPADGGRRARSGVTL